MHEFLKEMISVVVTITEQLGYLGIFIGMFLESTLFPIPSEIIMIPAGIASSKGSLNIYLVSFFGIIGNVAGAIFSYYLAFFLGRKIILKIGMYFFIKPQTIENIEVFFKNYGNISVFMGRLLPGFRHFISLPAGLAKMNFKLFFFYTSLGATIWTSILAFFGYFIGENQDLIFTYLRQITISLFVITAIIIVMVITYKKLKKYQS